MTVPPSWRVETCFGVPAIAAVEAEWAALDRSASLGEWFAGPDWILPWFESYGNIADLSLHLLRSERDGQLDGLLPLTSLPDAGWCAPRIGFPVNAQVRRVGLLARDHHAAVLEALLPSVLTHAADRCMTLQRVPVDSALDHAILTAVTHRSLGHYSTDELPSAIIDWSGGWDAYLRSRPGKLLRNLRSRARKLDEDHQWHWQVVTAARDLSEAWRAVLDIESRSWKEASGSSLTREVDAGSFYRRVAERCAHSGRLRLELLWHGDEPVAHALGVEDRGCLYLLKNSYVEAHRGSAPGNALVWRMMEHACARGLRAFDFLGDTSEWKRSLSTTEPAYRSHIVYSRGNVRGAACRQWTTRIKPMLRELRVVQTLKRRVKGR